MLSLSLPYLRALGRSLLVAPSLAFPVSLAAAALQQPNVPVGARLLALAVACSAVACLVYAVRAVDRMLGEELTAQQQAAPNPMPWGADVRCAVEADLAPMLRACAAGLDEAARTGSAEVRCPVRGAAALDLRSPDGRLECTSRIVSAEPGPTAAP